MRSGAKCTIDAIGGDEKLTMDNAQSIDNCSHTCKGKENCRFFVFNEKNGECKMESTKNAKCLPLIGKNWNEDNMVWEEDASSFYEIKSKCIVRLESFFMQFKLKHKEFYQIISEI